MKIPKCMRYNTGELAGYVRTIEFKLYVMRQS